MKKVTFAVKPSAAMPTASADAWVSDRPTPPEPVKRLTIDIPVSLHRRVKTGCVREDVAIADVVRIFLDRRFPAESQGSDHKPDNTETQKAGQS